MGTKKKEEPVEPVAEVVEPTEPVTEPVVDAVSDEVEKEATAETEPVVKSNFRKVKASQFTGTYRDAYFGDDGVCKNITDETLSSLKTDYPGIELEEVD